MLEMRWRIDGRRWLPRLLALACCCAVGAAGQAATITVAAAADLRFAMDEIVAAFEAGSREDRVEVVYRLVGKVPDADPAGRALRSLLLGRHRIPPPAGSGRPRRFRGAALRSRPHRALERQPGRDADDPRRAHGDPAITRIAIANPQHAPYGKRAEEALRAAGLWEKVEAKLVFGENIAQAAQFVETGNAQVGILALSLASAPSSRSRAATG